MAKPGQPGQATRKDISCTLSFIFRFEQYVYDALGRTIQVKQPNNSGSATYTYAGNTVTSTDAASKWKKFENDALGNLTKVTEPNPAGGANLETTYTYSELAQLLTVSMPRGGVTQTRTFVYNSTTQRLTSTTNPENGTTTNYYNADGTLDYKTDAKGQKIKYSYDSMQRVTMVQRYPNGVTEDPNQRSEFRYDYNDVEPSFSQYVDGRLAYTKTLVSGISGQNTIYEMYSYDPAGRVTTKRLRVSNYPSYQQYNYSGALLNTMTYPDDNVPLTYYYDAMSRPIRMTGNGPDNNGYPGATVDYVNSVNYNVAQRMTSFWQKGLGTSNFTYNERNELTGIQASGVSLQYEFSASADNGQILSRTMNGEKVAYQYDALKRLISATATVGGSTTWASTYTHDGWGNLLGKTPTAGSAPSLSVTVDGNTNRINSGGSTYDANGNMTSVGGYDVENRLVVAGDEVYRYLPNNQRIYKKDASGNEWIYLMDASGKRIGTLKMYVDGNGDFRINPAGSSRIVYFAGRMLGPVTDRLGSVVSAGQDYFPYGEQKASPAVTGEGFGTYLRDATGLDYADQRHYSSASGRFIKSDVSGKNDDFTNPGSLNLNTYTNGDPVNYNDPEGEGAYDIGFSFSYTDSGSGSSFPAWGPWSFTRIISQFAPLAFYMAAAPPGAAPPPTPGGVTSASQAQASLINKIDTLSGNCARQLASRTDLKNKAVEIKFYDARPDKQGLLSASTIVPGAVNAALKDIAFGANAYVINVGNRLTNYIVLKANFFTLASAADQKITLFHELLHYAYQKNDIDLARLFGIYDPKNPGGSSARISEWLKADCDKSKLK